MKYPDDAPRRPWKDLSPEAQELYLAVYRRTWEKCRAGGLRNTEALASRAHRAAVLAVESEFDGEGVDALHAPEGKDIGSRKADPPES